MAHLEFGQDRLAQPHSLQTFELAQRSVESPLEARFVAEIKVQSTTPSSITIQHNKLFSNNVLGRVVARPLLPPCSIRRPVALALTHSSSL